MRFVPLKRRSITLQYYSNRQCHHVGFFPFEETVIWKTAIRCISVEERARCLSVSLFSGCASVLVFSNSVPCFCVIFSCFLPSSVSLVHNVCTNFQASVQVNRNLVLPLVSRETIAIEVSIGECRASGCREIIYYQGIRVSGYQNIRILR